MVKLIRITIILAILATTLKKHALTLLLVIETIVLLLLYYAFWLSVDLFFVLMIISVGACEGAVGLRTLISMSRASNKWLA